MGTSRLLTTVSAKKICGMVPQQVRSAGLRNSWPLRCCFFPSASLLVDFINITDSIRTKIWKGSWLVGIWRAYVRDASRAISIQRWRRRWNIWCYLGGRTSLSNHDAPRCSLYPAEGKVPQSGLREISFDTPVSYSLGIQHVDWVPERQMPRRSKDIHFSRMSASMM